MLDTYKFVNEPLPYAYDALEPWIDELTMHLHHDRHLQTYIDNLNAILKDYPMLQKWPLERLIIDLDKVPKAIQTAIQNNAGGVFNHFFYFDSLTPNAMNEEFQQELKRNFGSVEQFQERFKKAALAVFGSGYAWLVTDVQGRLQIVTTTNQNTALSPILIPLLNIDVWEHAYYLKHYNLRSDYIDNWFHVVNWEMVALRYRKRKFDSFKRDYQVPHKYL